MKAPEMARHHYAHQKHAQAERYSVVGGSQVELADVTQQ
jgi:hypothetical protein